MIRRMIIYRGSRAEEWIEGWVGLVLPVRTIETGRCRQENKEGGTLRNESSYPSRKFNLNWDGGNTQLLIHK